MANRVQIVLEAEDLASGVLRGIVSQFGQFGAVVSDASDVVGKFNGFMDLQKRAVTDASITADMLNQSYAEAGASMVRLGETIAIAVVQTLQEAIKFTKEYSESIRDLSLISGESAENTSRFLQVLDDFQLTADDATVAAKALKEKGLSPNIETLAKLSDEFRKIKDPAERMAFVQENLGKGGAKWVNALNQGGEALRALSKDINANLILSDQQIQMYEVQRLALDNLSDSFDGFKVALGSNIGNVVAFGAASARAYEILKEQGVNILRVSVFSKEYKVALEEAIAEQLRGADASVEYTESLAEQEQAAQAAADALAELSKANQSLIDGAIEITNRNKDYQQSQDDIIQKIADTRAEGEKLYPWEAEKIAENQQKLEELGQAYFDNAEDFRAAMEEKFSLMAVEKIALEDGIAGFSDAEFEKARKILENQDIATAAAFEEQQAMERLTDAVANGTIPVEDWGAILDTVMADGVVSVGEVQAAIDAVPKQNTITFDIVTNGAPPNLDISSGSSDAPKGTHRNSHFAGGEFTIPASYGTEGFTLGNGDTASGGERLKISNGSNNTDARIIELLQQLVQKPSFTEYDLARVVGDAVLQVSQ